MFQFALQLQPTWLLYAAEKQHGFGWLASKRIWQGSQVSTAIWRPQHLASRGMQGPLLYMLAATEISHWALCQNPTLCHLLPVHRNNQCSRSTREECWTYMLDNRTKNLRHKITDPQGWSEWETVMTIWFKVSAYLKVQECWIHPADSVSLLKSPLCTQEPQISSSFQS